VNSCWQYLIKQEKEAENEHFFPSISFDKWEVIQMPYKTAKEFILEYEWLGNMGTSKYCYGLIIDRQISAVACYGPPVAPTKYQNILGKEISGGLYQLCRGASAYWAPKWAPSKLIALSLKELNIKYGIRAVIAYADEKAGEIGTVYQACNALYLGKTSPGGGKRYLINGHSYDPRKVVSKFGSRANSFIKTINPEFKTIQINPKHRYMFLLGNSKSKRELVNNLKSLVQPYPKREDSKTN
jgi:hypothetical protein